MSSGGHNHAHPQNTYVALVVVVAESCIEVALISVLGYILARRGVITNSVRKSLNKLVSRSDSCIFDDSLIHELNFDRVEQQYIHTLPAG